MVRGFKIGAIASLIMMVVFSCSTEKNTFINRNYHSLTAHYNGYYNANELIDQSMETFRSSRSEDYYKLIPIDPVPGESEVIGLYPAIDTAISKCKKVIVNHSMPSNDRPSRKKEEHNRWIDENWTTIGIASYYRRDYEGAMKSFKFVRKFYKNDPSLYVGELWIAKTNMAQGNLTEAKFNLDNLDQAIADEDERKKEKSSKKKSKKKKKKAKDEIAKFPVAIKFELEKTKAELALMKDEKEDAIEFLEAALEQARMGDDKARVHFVLGQLYQESGDVPAAKMHYSKVISGKASYDMNFNARLKRAFLGTGEKVKKELNKMLKDPKNSEFKDQIYYALAEIEFKENNEQQAIVYLHKSAFYSTTNTRQKGMAYERLADLSFSKRQYVPAQKYYDSCAAVIKDTYPNAEAIRNKASNLEKLVIAVETFEYEDSVQRIASLSEKDRERFLKDVIQQIKEDEAARKKREAEKLRELQENENLFADNGNGAKWYWNNTKTRSEGLNEFKRLWGQRENEDDWRRSEKTPVATFDNPNEEGFELDSLPHEPEDTLTIENLTRWIPLDEASMASSNKRLMEAHYNAGVIYKEQLNEAKLAEEQFFAALGKGLKEDPHDLLSAFQLYKLTEASNSLLAQQQKSYIISNYPESDYAKYLEDPDFFIKKKERDALSVKVYLDFIEKYSRGAYYPVLVKANDVIANEPDNIYRSKYMLMKAMCMGQLEEDKTMLLPILEQLVDEYPESEETPRAREMIGIIKNGYSPNEPYDFSNKSPFVYNDQVKVKVIVFLSSKVSSQSGKTRVSNFNREYFSRERLKVDSKIYGKDQGLILIDDFDDEMKAAAYIRAFKKTKKHLMDLRDAEIMMITRDNLKILLTQPKLKEYQEFYEEYY